jgi:hypothetical protein
MVKEAGVPGENLKLEIILYLLICVGMNFMGDSEINIFVLKECKKHDIFMTQIITMMFFYRKITYCRIYI